MRKMGYEKGEVGRKNNERERGKWNGKSNHATILLEFQGKNRGEIILIPRIKLAPSDINLPFVLERNQLPL